MWLEAPMWRPSMAPPRAPGLATGQVHVALAAAAPCGAQQGAPYRLESIPVGGLKSTQESRARHRGAH